MTRYLPDHILSPVLWYEIHIASSQRSISFSNVLGCYSSFNVVHLCSLVRCWNGAHLLHHSQHIQLSPTLTNLAIHDPINADRSYLNLFIAGRNAVKFAGMCTAESHADG